MPSGHHLLDVGGGARLERFATRVIDRPLPTALRARGDPDAWQAADLRFDRDRGWSGEAEARRPWPIEIDGVTLELRPTEAGQVGLFPEHAAMLPWLRAEVAARNEVGEPPAVLHLFAYTGLVTLALAAAGAQVTHVDAARPTVGWARHNAALSEPRGSADPLDRRRRRGVHRTRGPARPTVRRDRARPAVVRPRSGGRRMADR